MRWFALVLLLANAALWLFGDMAVPERVAVVSERQVLPRVADLKTRSVQNGPVKEAGESMPSEQEQAIAPVVVPSAPDPRLHCVRLGWFESAESARSTYRNLGSPGKAYEVREEEREMPPLHWVIVPPQPDDQALELFRDLQRRGIDSYLVTQGENRNAISLGLFESRQAAESVLEEKKRQNLNAILANFPRNQISYALVFEHELTPGSGAVEAVESEYADNFDLVEIRRCEGVATAFENP
ncbi:hypothetical protein QPM17_21735 [Marinobacter sp. TBZ242]|uniref:SPOR domain-containing protein n=1 Tax=Marinobacter azerbaijanicus TaxID=3050455 RepID=A0ABT7IJ92_9GAMM|nr:hypothetical protein [Marinobacter sp. TBZ242]MDL0433770.1 hypothetical protein [Marinobacter sp. TBZ242]